MNTDASSADCCPKCGSPLKKSKSNANRGAVVTCTRCRQRSWYEKNKERVKADSKGYYQKTRKRRIKLAKKWREENIEQHRRNARKFKLKNKYGITLEQFDQMMEEQKGLCFLCQKPSPNGRRLSIDHCHKENRVRKLLCEFCNRALGFIERDPAWVTRAIEYLKS
jgi:uncharacterized Zn finger protein (UPF0148 family)